MDLGRRILQWCLRIYAVYLLLCLLVLLPALNIMAPRLVKEFLNRELSTELILFNPFALSLEIRGANLREVDGHQPLGFNKAEINLSLASLSEPGIVLDRFLIDQLEVHVLRHADGQFHFVDLVGGDAQDEADEEPPAALPGVTIDNLTINAHTLRFTDRSKPGEYTTVQRDFSLNTRNLTTVPGRQGDGALELTGHGGGRLRWTGELEVAEGRSTGALTLENIDLTHIWRYEQERVAFVPKSARLSASLNYAADWNHDLQLLVSRSELRLHDTDIQPKDRTLLPDTAVSLDDLQINDINVDLAAQRLDVAGIVLSGLTVSGFDEAGDPSLLKLFALASTDATETDNGEQAKPEEPQENTSTWTLRLGGITLKDSDVTWKTDYLSPDAVQVTPIALAVGELRWPAENPTPFDLALDINQETHLELSGAINVGSGDGSADVALASWPIPWLNPIINARARSDISRGTFAVESKINLSGFAPQRVTANLSVKQLATVLHTTGGEAFTLEELAIAGIDVDMEQQQLRIDELLLQRPAGSLYILEDGSINLNGIVRERPEAQTSEQSEGESSEPWQVYLKHLTLHSGRLDFADNSLPIPFKTLIDGIEADVRDIDTASENLLTVDLNGTVDGYAPVLIQGSGRPLAENRNGELRFNFRGVDIAMMSPYSGTYAGYSIDSGTLSLDLGYALDGQTVKGDNRIIISQMKLGEPVESELALDVPLKLGLALLTDSKGVIDLSVPISGDLNNPDFSLGPIIGKAISNIIVKAVTAPFSLLAGLVGSNEDLENVDFAAGSSTLNAEGRKALSALAEALTQRPQLSLRVAGAADPAADGKVLKERIIRDALLAAGLSVEALENRNEELLDALQARLNALGIPMEPAQDETPDIELLWARLLETTTLPAGALQNLATERAAATKRELVTIGAIDAARIAIAYDPQLKTSGVKMDVDS